MVELVDEPVATTQSDVVAVVRVRPATRTADPLIARLFHGLGLLLAFTELQRANSEA